MGKNRGRQVEGLVFGIRSAANSLMVDVPQHPFDTIKVRLQTQGRNGRFSGPWNCLSETIRNEGVLAMYKGITPPLLTIGVVNSIMFGLQGITVGKITGE